jgi:hypothetical protein
VIEFESGSIGSSRTLFSFGALCSKTRDSKGFRVYNDLCERILEMIFGGSRLFKNSRHKVRLLQTTSSGIGTPNIIDSMFE